MTQVSEAEREALRASGFDPEWYIEQYPDVKMLGMDPAEHYLWVGKKLGRKKVSDDAVQSRTVFENKRSSVCDARKYFLAIAEGFPPNEGISRLMLYIWNMRPDLRAAFDISSSEGREQFREWFLISALREHNLSSDLLSDEFLIRLASSSNHAGTEARKLLAERSKTVNGEYACVAARTEINERGANLIGYATAQFGMGEHVRMVAGSLNATGIPFDLVNVPVGGHGAGDESVSHWINQQQRFRINVFCINADMYPLESLRYGVGFYNIGYWAWELPLCPDEFVTALQLVDEVWACSQFTANAFSGRSSVPVLSMPLAVSVPDLSSSIYTKARYGLPSDKFIFLFTFDAASYLDRKNPIDVVRAFNLAFPKGNENVHLVFKVQNTEHVVNSGSSALFWRAFLDEIGDSKRISIINKRYSREDVFGLQVACDAFVSLHRSEGFGRNIAEAMSYGKPVVATDFSGSSEFVRDQTACPIKYNLIPVPETSYPFSDGQYWAQPDIEHAAWAMQKLFHDDTFRFEKGRAGQHFIRENFNERAIGKKYATRLSNIRARVHRFSGVLEGDMAPVRKYVQDKTTAVFTIVSKNYMSFARTLLQSVVTKHPDFALFLCLADEPGPNFEAKSEPFFVVPASQLSIPTFQDMILRYDVMEFNTAVKPFMFEWLLSETDVDKVIYLDPDIYVYGRLDEVVTLLDQGSAVLTPHVTEPLASDGCFPSDHDILKAGVFNLGFMAIRRCEESRRFIKWWGEKLKTGAIAEFEQNLFTDQRWCDLAPCFLSELKILRGAGYNVAYWNLSNRKIGRSHDGSIVVNDDPLVFFHFSGINPRQLDVVSKHQNRFRWDELSDPCRKLFQAYADTLLRNGWEEMLKHPYSYNIVDGLELRPIIRHLYRSHNPSPRLFADFKAAKSYLLDLCRSPLMREGAGQECLSELQMFIYNSRPDIQKAFDVSVDQGRRALKRWFESSGLVEYGLSSDFAGV